MWDEIDPISFSFFDPDLKNVLPRLRNLHLMRAQSNEEYQLMLQQIERLKKEKERNVVSLNIEKRKEEREEREALKKKLKELHKKSGHDDREDFYLLETAHILGDYILIH